MNAHSPLIRAWTGIVRFGFRLLYNEFAFTYDTVSKVVSFGAWRCWGRAGLKHLNAAAGDAVLEIAHGTGDIHVDLHAAGYRVIGIDLSPNMGKIASRKLRKQGIIPALARGKAQALPFASESFAAVISTFPAEFIVAPETLREVNRVLRPGGRFVIVPNAMFTSKDAGTSALDFLYRITGQRTGPSDEARARHSFDLASLFAPYGFDTHALEEVCPRSLVTVIIAEKRANKQN